MNKYSKIIKLIVNLITINRIIFSFILLSIFNKINKYIFIISLIILFLTDFIDGFLARKFMVQSLFGSSLDTVADKTLSILLIFPLIKEYPIILLILLGEISIALLNIIGKIKGKHTRSSSIGKIKMWIISINIIISYISYFNIIKINIIIPTIITFIFQLHTIIEYFYYLKKQSSNPKITEYKIKNYQDLIYILFNTNYFLENIQSRD